MNDTEIKQVLSILKVAYPSSFKDLSLKEANGTIALWSSQFNNIPVELMLKAINNLIKTSVFIPTIAEINKELINLSGEQYIKLDAAGKEKLLGADFNKSDKIYSKEELENLYQSDEEILARWSNKPKALTNITERKLLN